MAESNHSALADADREMAIREILRVEGDKPQVPEEVRAAFHGDADAALGLSSSLEDHNRGAVAIMMWRARVPHEAFAAYLASVWDHDHHHVIRAAQTRRRLAALFRYAQFPKPASVPERVTVWRGTSKLTKHQATRGYSWTLDRDTACWFAMRFAKSNGRPLVLRAEIDAADVALFHDGRGEAEAVLMKLPTIVAIDGDTEDWATAAERHEAQKHAEKMALLGKLKPGHAQQEGNHG